MSSPFGHSTVLKDTDEKATLRVSHRKFKKSDEAHSVLKDGNLHITATIGEEAHEKIIADVDIEPATKIEKSDGHFDVKIKKKSKFKLADKMTPKA